MDYLTFISYIGSWFSMVWTFLKGIEVPFMQGVSFAGLFVGLFVAGLGFRVFAALMGFSADLSGVKSRVKSVRIPKESRRSNHILTKNRIENKNSLVVRDND